MLLTERDAKSLRNRDGKHWRSRLPRNFECYLEKARAKLPEIRPEGRPPVWSHSVAVPPLTINFSADVFSEEPEWYVQSWYYDIDDPRYWNLNGYARRDRLGDSNVTYYRWFDWRTKWARPLKRLRAELKRLPLYTPEPYITEFHGEYHSGNATLWISLENIGFTVMAKDLVSKGPDAIIRAMLKRRRAFRERFPYLGNISKSAHITFSYSPTRDALRQHRRWLASRSRVDV